MAASNGSKALTDGEAVERLRAILVNAANGQRNIADDRQYPQLRRRLDKKFGRLPRQVSLHPSIDSFVAAIGGVENRKGRVGLIHEQFDEFTSSIAEPQTDTASEWTGVKSRSERLLAVRTILPIAQQAIDEMIGSLSTPGDNNGPLLDETEEQIEVLRQLHYVLGQLLQAADDGALDDELGQDLAAKAFRWGKSLPKLFASDPMPYAASILLFSSLSACGLPGWGGMTAGIALTTLKGR